MSSTRSPARARKWIVAHRIETTGFVVVILGIVVIIALLVSRDNGSSSLPNAQTDDRAPLGDASDSPIDTIPVYPTYPVYPTSSPTEFTAAPGSTNQTNTTDPTAGPTQFQAGSSSLLDALKLVSDPDVFNDASTAQSRAADWLISLDTYGVTADSVNLYQRYALAVLYFATGGGVAFSIGWEKCNATPDPVPPNTTDIGEVRCVWREGVFLCAETSDFIECTYQVDGNPVLANRFLSPVNECDWFGITCDDLDKVTEIVLPNNSLNGTLPTELGLLEELDTLVLDYNELKGSLHPASVKTLKKLKVLSLQRNEIGGQLPSEVGELAELDKLLLQYNRFTDRIPSEIGKLNKLWRLFLDHNSFQGEIPKIGNLTNLAALSLSDNELEGELPEGIYGLTKLEKFFVSKNKLLGTISSEIGKLTDLDRLYLHDNEFSGLIHPEFGFLTKLRELRLHWNNFQGSVPVEICPLAILEELTADCSDPPAGSTQITCGCCTRCCSKASRTCATV